MKSDLTNMGRAWNQEKKWNRTHDLPNIIYHTHDDFDSAADPSSIQDACHIWTQLNDIALHEFSQLSG